MKILGVDVRAILVALALVVCGGAAPITPGPPSVPLNGPWKFHIGDNPGWSAQQADDSSWESVDLTPPPGAHDDDVGLSGFVPGWGARGHKAYGGYGWYRMTVTVAAPATLYLTGPPAVDSLYQVFFNGHLLGGGGDFSGAKPVAYAIQPRLFALPAAWWSRSADGQAQGVIAVRAWRSARAGLAAPSGGGMRIAPTLGTQAGANARYRLQWLQTVEGYVVEVIEPLVFAALAVMALMVGWFGNRGFYRWLAAALLLTAATRLNQAVYFWLQVESVTQFVLLRQVLLDPLTLAAWIMAWRARLAPALPHWLPRLLLALVAVWMIAQLCLQFGAISSAASAITIVRLALLLLYGAVLLRGAWRGDWLVLPAALLIAIGQFAGELNLLGVPGIWFPFGVGVSRAQYAYAVFDIVLFWLLASDLRRRAI